MWEQLVKDYIEQEIYTIERYGCDEEDSNNLDYLKELNDYDIKDISYILATEYDDIIYDRLKDLVYEKKESEE